MRKGRHHHPHCAIFFKDFSHWCRASCVGLNVAGYSTADYLRKHGVRANGFAVKDNIDVANAIKTHNFSHVVISAPWLSLYDLKALVRANPQITFAVLSHSNVGFLQADPGAIKLLRAYAKFARQVDNLYIGGNNPGFTRWFREAYDNERSILLPNMYDVEPGLLSRRWGKDYEDGINIGALGAIRPEKNLMTAAAGALLIQKRLNVPVKLHMSTGGELFKSRTLDAIDEMVADVPAFSVVRHHWDFWDNFIKLIQKMHLVIQCSYTESFNMITADAIANRVPAVVSPVIYWAPKSWMANPDDASDIADVGVDLLRHNQNYKGSQALYAHNLRAFERWLEFLLFS